MISKLIEVAYIENRIILLYVNLPKLEFTFTYLV